MYIVSAGVVQVLCTVYLVEQSNYCVQCICWSSPITVYSVSAGVVQVLCTVYLLEQSRYSSSHSSPSSGTSLQLPVTMRRRRGRPARNIVNSSKLHCPTLPLPLPLDCSLRCSLCGTRKEPGKIRQDPGKSHYLSLTVPHLDYLTVTT